MRYRLHALPRLPPHAASPPRRRAAAHTFHAAPYIYIFGLGLPRLFSLPVEGLSGLRHGSQPPLCLPLSRTPNTRKNKRKSSHSPRFYCCYTAPCLAASLACIKRLPSCTPQSFDYSVSFDTVGFRTLLLWASQEHRRHNIDVHYLMFFDGVVTIT